MSRPRVLDVAVVGAGPAGLAAALRLSGLGLKVAVLTRKWPQPWSPADDYDLRVVALAPDAQALLNDLGVWPAIAEARAQPVAGMRIEESGSDTTLSFDAASSGQQALAWIVELSLLNDRLARAWQGSGGLIEDGVTVSAMHADSSPTDNDLAVLHLDNGERLRARLVVAADGADSPLRAAAGIGVAQRDYQQQGVVCAVSTSEPHRQLARQRFTGTGPLAFLPLADGRSSIVWSTANDHAEYLLRLPRPEFCRALEEAAQGMLGSMVDCGKRAAFPLRLQLARHYSASRLVLLGDAAHQVHPLAGQGLNLGLRDVRRLAEVLDWARRGDLDLGSADVLRRYERPQRSENWLAAHAFDGLERWFGITQGPLAQIRRTGFRWIAESPLAKQWLTRLATG